MASSLYSALGALLAVFGASGGFAVLAAIRAAGGGAAGCAGFGTTGCAGFGAEGCAGCTS